jgi:hypothetical protein
VRTSVAVTVAAELPLGVQPVVVVAATLYAAYVPDAFKFRHVSSAVTPAAPIVQSASL